MKVLVCGGRDYSDKDCVFYNLYILNSRTPITQIIEGGAKGADKFAALWAYERGIINRCFPADWDQFGRYAGHKRNKQMLDEGKPDWVMAFPGGRGTANMIEQANKAGVPVQIIL